MAKSKHKNSEYWEDRIANETWRTYNSVEEQNRDLLQMYEKTSSSIKRELYALAETAEEQGGLTRTQQYRFNKLLGNQGVIFQEIEKLGDKVNKTQSNRINDAGKKVYGNVMNELGIEDFNYPNKKEMEQMLRSPWHGSFFSKRLWENMGVLERNLNGVINSGLATGKITTEMAVQLSNIMNKTFNEAHRLVRTETINYMNRSALRGYKDAGIAKVQWWAAKDERTCDICGANHEREYDIENAPILPCHPGCRCTWLPVIDRGMKLGNGKSKESNISKGEFVENISDKKEIDKFINKYENEIAREKKEISYIIQSNGDVFRYYGTKGSVSFEGANIKNTIILHNHPLIDGIESNSFEDDDFWFLQHHGLEINKLRATYGNWRYEVIVLKDLSSINYDSYKYGEIGTSLMYGEIEGELHELIFKELDKEGFIKYEKTKAK